MATYLYRCERHGVGEVTCEMGTAPATVSCGVCGDTARRVFAMPAVIYACDGFHATDYDEHGDKRERLNRVWSAAWGEEPPPPARDVPKNSTEKGY